MHVTNLLLWAQDETVRNAAVLDCFSAYCSSGISSASSSSYSTSYYRRSSSSNMPISKHLLTSIFRQIHDNNDQRPYVYIENSRHDHFPYGLVVPLLARILAVSCPGLLCIAELPRTTKKKDKSTQPNLDKSHARSCSPVTDVDEIVEKKRSGGKGLATRTRDSNSNDGATLHLMCNGFEVLTGRMPKSAHRDRFGNYTLNAVGWSKAGVMSPKHEEDGVIMRFSNKLMVPTEGIVVTYTNGSMVQLTINDPIDALENSLVPKETPILVFVFSRDGRRRLEDCFVSEDSDTSEEADKMKELIEKRNIFAVEIGHRGSLLTRRALAAEKYQRTSIRKASVNPVSKRAPRDSSPETDASGIRGNGNLSGSGSDTLESFPDKDAPVEEQEFYGLPPPGGRTKLPPANAVTTDTVPNAVPLFVNTLNARDRKEESVNIPRIDEPGGPSAKKRNELPASTEVRSRPDETLDEAQRASEKSGLEPTKEVPKQERPGASGVPQSKRKRSQPRHSGHVSQPVPITAGIIASGGQQFSPHHYQAPLPQHQSSFQQHHPPLQRHDGHVDLSRQTWPHYHPANAPVYYAHPHHPQAAGGHPHPQDVWQQTQLSFTDSTQLSHGYGGRYAAYPPSGQTGFTTTMWHSQHHQSSPNNDRGHSVQSHGICQQQAAVHTGIERAPHEDARDRSDQMQTSMSGPYIPLVSQGQVESTRPQTSPQNPNRTEFDGLTNPQTHCDTSGGAVKTVQDTGATEALISLKRGLPEGQAPPKEAVPLDSLIGSSSRDGRRRRKNTIEADASDNSADKTEKSSESLLKRSKVM